KVWRDFTVPFDFEQCLSRFWIVHSLKGTAVLHACHHSISDAISMAALGDELRALMQGEHFEGIDLGFLKLASNAERARRTQAYARARSYFEDAIERMGFASSIPASDDAGGNHAGTAFVALPGCAERVDAYAREQGMTRGMVFHAAFSHVLACLCMASPGGSAKPEGADPGAVMYKTGLHGRYEDGFEKALGCFADFTIVVNEHAGSLQESCGSIKQVMLGTIERSVYPYKLLKDAHPDITHLMFFEYVPLADTHEAGRVKRVRRHGCELTVEHVPARDDSQVMGSLIAAVYDTEDGFVFTAEHSSKYSEGMIEVLALDFFNALLELIG
ncbi:MAG: condensation domain-containing protein, partial [Eggerthellaceae bacterium]|nr:condensation domain-containing protein [Eggerthellaceae bacterium]